MRAVRKLYATLLLILVAAALLSLWVTPLWGSRVRPHNLVFVLFVVGLLLTVTSARRTLSHISTFAHELSHCAGAALVGATPRKIIYNPDSSGLAVLEFPERVGRYRRSVVLMAGYLGPLLAAGALLSGLTIGKSRETLFVVSVVSGVSLLLLVRNLWGVLITSILGFLAWSAASHLPDAASQGVIALLIGILCGLGVADTIGQYRLPDPAGCDAEAASFELHRLPWKLIAATQVLMSLALAVLNSYFLFSLYRLNA